jgi:elongation factor P
VLSTTNFRKGLRIKLDGEIYYILSFQHARTAQRRAFVRTRLKNLRTGAVLEKTFPAGEVFEEPDFEEKTMQYLYQAESEYHFMDAKSFEQIGIAEDKLSGAHWFLQEGTEYKILFFEGNPLNVELPASVALKVISVGPGQRGDSVTNIMKEAVLETGLRLKVPVFIKEGERIKVDTRTTEYIERV